jgi:hypothetical protein
MFNQITNPKLKTRDDNSRSSWFRYYAGFSTQFVEDVINSLNLPKGAIILDPWLGAGTTAEVAVAKGIRAKGVEINPAALVVARARLAPSGYIANLENDSENICSQYRQNLTLKQQVDEYYCPRNDPLATWLQPRSVQLFRRLELLIRRLEPGTQEARHVPLWRHAQRLSPPVALQYVALFRTLRHFIAQYQTTNPTWTKIPEPKDRIQISASQLLKRFCHEAHWIRLQIEKETRLFSPDAFRKCALARASSVRLPLPTGSIDAVITSPPYCTRIDYVRATLPELAVINFPDGPKLKRLRDAMLGTPTISKRNYGSSRLAGTKCEKFLKSVEVHVSKASLSYYLPYYFQYFSSLALSLSEIDRVL